MELVALKDITQESVMSFFEALQIVLEHLVLSFDDLHLTKSKLGVQAVLDVIQVEHFFPNGFDVKLFDHVLDVVFTNNDRRYITIIKARGA